MKRGGDSVTGCRRASSFEQCQHNDAAMQQLRRGRLSCTSQHCLRVCWCALSAGERTTCWLRSPGKALYVAFSDGAASSRRFVSGLGPTTISGSAAVRWESTTATTSATTAATRVASVNVAAAEGGQGRTCV